ncbi:hypothetical protein AVEN_197994-1 [Araneus ventricosus]|uniref:Uncharacterized protein n=1 Tax=Araneus ventricosus TaxID=182803 RepID=A0A4Y2IB46_ARAVE|nr:hypothetical protein AVEN_197994-1 [Araneus ventricosus]
MISTSLELMDPNSVILQFHGYKRTNSFNRTYRNTLLMTAHLSRFFGHPARVNSNERMVQGTAREQQNHSASDKPSLKTFLVADR